MAGKNQTTSSVVEPEARVEQELVLLKWSGHARPYRKMSTSQVMTVPVVISVLVGIVLLLAGEWMLLLVVGALVFAYYSWTMVKPDETTYSITTRGVRVAGQLYEWPVLYRWWLGEQWGHKLLLIETSAVVMERLVLPLDEQKAGEIERIMKRMLLNEKPEDTGVDKLGRWLAEKFPLVNEK